MADSLRFPPPWDIVKDVTGEIGGHGKVWIDGVGFMRDARRLRDGREKANAGKLVLLDRLDLIVAQNPYVGW
jgi:hypothetical protein